MGNGIGYSLGIGYSYSDLGEWNREQLRDLGDWKGYSLAIWVQEQLRDLEKWNREQLRDLGEWKRVQLCDLGYRYSLGTWENGIGHTIICPCCRWT